MKFTQEKIKELNEIDKFLKDCSSKIVKKLTKSYHYYHIISLKHLEIHWDTYEEGYHTFSDVIYVPWDRLDDWEVWTDEEIKKKKK